MPPASNGDNPQKVLGEMGFLPKYISEWQSARGIGYEARGCPRLWVFVSHAGDPYGTPGTRALYTELEEFRHNLSSYYSDVSVTNRPSVSVELYQRKHAAPS
jgi:hypothetical protein